MPNTLEYNDIMYDKPRAWIEANRTREWPWEQIRYGKKNGERSPEEILSWLKDKSDEDGWPQLSLQGWNELINLRREYEIRTAEYAKYMLRAGAAGGFEAKIPESDSSSWRRYVHYLREEKEWLPDSIENLKHDILAILRETSPATVNPKTQQSEPRKGLVIGNVQSGKTSNFAGLMALAGDNTYNMFVVLSGTIENLRQQTVRRLTEALTYQPLSTHTTPALNWRHIERPAAQIAHFDRLTNLQFNANQRYFTVVLKNATRIQHLLDWLGKTEAQLANIKMIVIDDEADQASINTNKIEDEDPTKINGLISKLITLSGPRAINYIGYTATPYANVLNEGPGPQSLYPEHFIYSLPVGPDYFGPRRLFGYDNETESTRPLGMMRSIEPEHLEAIKKIHNKPGCELPPSLQSSLFWFLLAASVARVHGYKKPVTMMIHTSHLTGHHESLASALETWLKSATAQKEAALVQLEEMYLAEAKKLTCAAFREIMPDYPYEVVEMPSFEDIRDILEKDFLNQEQIMRIMMDGQGAISYHRGLHLCIDNSKAGGKPGDGIHMRLIYPEPENAPDYNPAFIVIGGNTLSRGITLEGLVSSYFLRTSTTQYDTLMQMGRWFGYRKGYELLPRVWLTENSRANFRFLVAVEESLRAEIKKYNILGKTPRDFGPAVRLHPDNAMRITARNRMQGIEPAEVDFTGIHNQTTYFKNDKDWLEKNSKAAIAFINDILSSAVPCESSGADGRKIFKGIEHEKIIDLLKKGTQFHDKNRFIAYMPYFLEWLNQDAIKSRYSGGWNVILASGEGKSLVWVDSNVERGLRSVERTIDVTESGSTGSLEFRINNLDSPSDRVADLPEGERVTDDGWVKARSVHAPNTCLMIMYMIAASDLKLPKPKNADEDTPKPAADICADVLGISLIVPDLSAASDGSHSPVRAVRVSIPKESILGTSDIVDQE